MKRHLTRLGIITASLVAGLLLAEGILRLAGVDYPLYPKVDKPLEPFFKEPAFVEDEQLFWVKEGYAQALKQARMERPALALMGDSCTEDGKYAGALLKELASRGRTMSGYVNLGVGAYTSFQGMRQLQRDTLPLQPRVVTLYFGWNDHWINNDITDAQVADMLENPFFGLRDLRLVQLLHRALTLGSREEIIGFGQRMRVPLLEFKQNLRYMVHLARERRVDPVLLTAPTSHEPDTRKPPPGQEAPPDLKGAVHLRYVQAVRDLAREDAVFLCDLHRAVADLPAAERARYFTGDGIHLSDAGGRLVARLLADCLEEAVLLDAVSVKTAVGEEKQTD